MVVRTVIPTIRSRKPGANRSIWATIASVASPEIAVRHMCVRPQRVDVADGALRVGQVLLADQNERALRHASRVDIALGGGEFGVAAHDVNGAGRAAPTRWSTGRHLPPRSPP